MKRVRMARAGRGRGREDWRMEREVGMMKRQSTFRSRKSASFKLRRCLKIQKQETIG
jgi:hypothetical protein